LLRARPAERYSNTWEGSTKKGEANHIASVQRERVRKARKARDYRKNSGMDDIKG